MTTNRRDPYGQLAAADLQVIARARRLDVPAGAGRDEVVAALRAHDAQEPNASVANLTPSAAPERGGWWTSMSVPELRDLARDHGIDVAAGMRRRQVVELLVAHDVPDLRELPLAAGDGRVNAASSGRSTPPSCSTTVRSGTALLRDV